MELEPLTLTEQRIYREVEAYMSSLLALGVNNMLNSEQFIQSAFNLDVKLAHKLYLHWSENYIKLDKLQKLITGDVYQEKE